MVESGEVQEVCNTLKRMGVIVSPEQVRDELELFAKYKVTGSEAVRAVVHNFMQSAGVKKVRYRRQSVEEKHVSSSTQVICPSCGRVLPYGFCADCGWYPGNSAYMRICSELEGVDPYLSWMYHMYDVCPRCGTALERESYGDRLSIWCPLCRRKWF